MSADYPQAPSDILTAFRWGLVIPAHPLALTAARTLDERRQRALSRYYLDAGAGGLAVGVHTTEFAIHRLETGLYRPVLQLAMDVARNWPAASNSEPASTPPSDAHAPGSAPVPPTGGKSASLSSAPPLDIHVPEGRSALPASAPPLSPPAGPVMIAGIIGRTEQAVREAGLARELGYHIGLIGLGALKEASDAQLLDHVRQIARVIPVMGFYLQPAAGGRILSEGFWRRLAEVPNLAGIKIAPFNRYHTLTVVRAVAESGRAGEVALYTGNDDSILIDLLTRYELRFDGRTVRTGIVGGLLGHWAYWTKRAVEHLELARRHRGAAAIPAEALTLAAQITESNEAVFDPQNDFRGCICGILYVLSRSGLLEGVRSLGEGARLSPGQSERIERILTLYPHLTDHDFVRDNLDHWLTP
jgi:hypothetical protein